MRTFFMLLAVLAGAALPIQASINAEFAARGRHRYGPPASRRP